MEKMQVEMAKLQADGELYEWLTLTLGAQEPRRLAAAFQATLGSAGEELIANCLTPVGRRKRSRLSP